jgi:hypothetical protein
VARGDANELAIGECSPASGAGNLLDAHDDSLRRRQMPTLALLLRQMCLCARTEMGQRLLKNLLIMSRAAMLLPERADPKPRTWTGSVCDLPRWFTDRGSAPAAVLIMNRLVTNSRAFCNPTLKGP